MTNIAEEIQRLDKVYLEFFQGHLARTGELFSDESRTFGSVFADKAVARGDKVAMIFDDQAISYAELDLMANRIGFWLLEQDVSEGDKIAIAMRNRPEFVACLIGCSKIGVAVSLINPDVNGATLAHVLGLGKPKLVLAEAEPKGAILELPEFSTLFIQDIDALQLASISAVDALDRIERNVSSGGLMADACFINTSGTTGLPKAAAMNNRRLINSGMGAAAGMKLDESSVMYNCLPLFHTNGLQLGLVSILLSGGTIVLKKRLSVKDFWADCIKYKVTNFVYIGDLCRFLNNHHTKPLSEPHYIKSIFGNGMAKDVWEEFNEKFKVPRIVEFYSATESNVSLFNLEGKPGSVGYHSDMMRTVLPGTLLKYDVETDEHVLDEDGNYILCGPGEVGELVGKLDPTANHRIYTDEAESNKKVLTDVFEKGDRYFKSGDLMTRDEIGWHYFVDRIGDTFRWRGENVSTLEVEEQLRAFPGIEEICVYGVEVPNESGRAGMASIVPADGFDIDALFDFVEDKLPKQARPLFIRLQDEIEKTPTMKPKKALLKKAGIKPGGHDDPLHWNDGDGFKPFSENTYADIRDRKIRL